MKRFHRYPELQRILLIIVAVFIVALPLSILTAGDNVLHPDVAVTEEVQEVNASPVESAVSLLNQLGETPTMFALSAAIGAALIVFGRKRDAVFVVTPVVLSQLANATLKLTFESPRPTDTHVDVVASAGGFGFPSGHTMMTVVFVGSLAFLVFRNVQCRWRRGIAAMGALLLAFGMGFSRVYVGAHWPSDVLGAYLWGIAFTALMVLAYLWTHPARDDALARARHH